MKAGEGRGAWGGAADKPDSAGRDISGARRCPGNAPLCDRRQQGTGEGLRRRPSPAKHPEEMGPGGTLAQGRAGRGLDSWRRAPTRLERLSAPVCGPRAPESIRKEARGLGEKASGLSPGAGQRGMGRGLLGSQGLPRSVQVREMRAARDLRRKQPPVQPTLCAAARVGDGVRERVTWAPERSQRQQEPERRRPARGRHGPRRAVGAARGCSSRAPGPARGSRSSPRRLRPGAGHGSLPARRSSPDAGAGAGGASSAAPLRALLGSAVRWLGSWGRRGSAPRALAGCPALGPSYAAPAAAAAAPAPQRPSHPGRAAAAAAAASATARTVAV